jgi:hypothetical protein
MKDKFEKNLDLTKTVWLAKNFDGGRAKIIFSKRREMLVTNKRTLTSTCHTAYEYSHMTLGSIYTCTHIIFSISIMSTYFSSLEK